MKHLIKRLWQRILKAASTGRTAPTPHDDDQRRHVWLEWELTGMDHLGEWTNRVIADGVEAGAIPEDGKLIIATGDYDDNGYLSVARISRMGDGLAVTEVNLTDVPAEYVAAMLKVGEDEWPD